MSGTGLRPGRVLVVDDSAVVRDLISLNLGLEGFEVSTAQDGQQALDMIARERPDVVTLDVMMSEGLGGFETLAKIRADPAIGDLPVVMVTGRSHPDDVTRGTDLGADAYVAKPFEPSDLVDVVCRLAAGADTLDG